MCDRGRTITHLQISRFHTQVWINWGHVTDVSKYHNGGKWRMDWEILRSMFKNIYNTLYSCQHFPAGSRQAARGAHICETSLLSCVSIGGGGGGGGLL